MAGNASRAARSRNPRRDAIRASGPSPIGISSVMSIEVSGSDIRSAPLAGPQLLKELRRRLEIGIDMEHATDQRHRVRPQDVDHKIASEPGYVVDTDHDMSMLGVDEIRTSFEFDKEIVDAF